MDDYFIGTDVLGAEATLPMPPADPFSRLSALKNDAALAEQRRKAANAATSIIIGGVVGCVLGGGIGAAGWAAHRFWGFFFGSMLGGPLGAGIGTVIAAQQVD